MKKTTFLVLMLFCVALLLSGCSKKQTLPPADPFRDALTLCAEADSIVMYHYTGHPDYPHLYRQITGAETIQNLVSDLQSRLGEMDRDGGGWVGNKPVLFTFYKGDVPILEVLFLDLNYPTGNKTRIRIEDTWQWYTFDHYVEFAQTYWEMAEPIEEVGAEE